MDPWQEDTNQSPSYPWFQPPPQPFVYTFDKEEYLASRLADRARYFESLNQEPIPPPPPPAIPPPPPPAIPPPPPHQMPRQTPLPPQHLLDQRMTCDEAGEFDMLLMMTGNFHALPVIKGLGLLNHVRHFPPEHIERMDFASGCKQALKKYNADEDAGMEFMGVVMANSQMPVYYVTFVARDPNGCDVMFQATLMVEKGPGSFIVMDVCPKP